MTVAPHVSLTRVLILVAMLGSVACDSAADESVTTVTFKPLLGDALVACGQSYTGVGSSGSTIELKDFRLYVHGVTFVAADGALVPLELEADGVWQVDDIALLDFEDRSGACANGTAETNFVVRGRLPEGDYRALRFTLGVPEERNHGDAATAPSPLNLSKMFWSWTGGYKFLRLDVNTTGQPLGYNVHIGSTSCNGGPTTEIVCDEANRAEVQLADFDPATDAVVFDVAALYADSDVDTNGEPAPGCMSDHDDPDCPAIFGKFGLSTDGGAAPPQTVFVKGAR